MDSETNWTIYDSTLGCMVPITEDPRVVQSGNALVTVSLSKPEDADA